MGGLICSPCFFDRHCTILANRPVCRAHCSYFSAATAFRIVLIPSYSKWTLWWALNSKGILELSKQTTSYQPGFTKLTSNTFSRCWVVFHVFKWEFPNRPARSWGGQKWGNREKGNRQVTNIAQSLLGAEPSHMQPHVSCCPTVWF